MARELRDCLEVAAYCHNYRPHPGGLEAIVEALCRGQVAAGHRVTLTTTAWEGRKGAARESGLEVHRMPAVHLTERFGVPYPIPYGPGLRKAAVASRSADVHHAHGALYPTTLLARRLSGRASRPLVVTEHVGVVPYNGRLPTLLQTLAWRWIGWRTLAAASAIVAYNRRVHEWLCGRLPGRAIEFIPNGIDLDVFHPAGPEAKAESRRAFGLPADGSLALFVGRDTPKKNLEALLGIRHEGFRVVCCGAARKLPDGVIDLGLVPHERMAGLYGAVDFFVHIGVGEGFPVAVQEAAASGLPVLLLWDEGYADSIGREHVLALASLTELESSCARLAGSHDLRAVLGRRARLHAECSWSWTRTVDRYEAVYRRALSEAGGSATRSGRGTATAT